MQKTHMKIRGKIIIIGGSEDKGLTSAKDETDDDADVNRYYETGVLKRLVNESVRKDKSRIEILTTASTVPQEIGQDYIDAFARLGAKDVGVINIESRDEASDESFLARLKACQVIMVTGGDQMRLTSLLGGTAFLDLLHEKLIKEDFVYAGSSAGAAAASNIMVFKGASDEALLKGKIRITAGLGLLNNVIVDTHFVTRGRIGRLFQSVVANPQLLGIGMEENAALLIKNNVMEAIGPEMTILVDGRNIADTNFIFVEEGEAISIENLTVHVMSKYDTYDLTEHKLTIDHRNNRDEK